MLSQRPVAFTLEPLGHPGKPRVYSSGLRVPGDLRITPGEEAPGPGQQSQESPTGAGLLPGALHRPLPGPQGWPERHPQRVLPGWGGRVTSATFSPGNYVTSTLPFLLVKVISIQAVNCS